MLIRPRIEVKAIERNPVRSDRDNGHRRAHLAVEAVLVHAEIPRCISEPDQSRHQNGGPQLDERAQALTFDPFFESFRRLRGRVLTHVS
jgi:hypothetical protein